MTIHRFVAFIVAACTTIALAGCGAPHNYTAARVQLVNLTTSTLPVRLAVDGVQVKHLADANSANLSKDAASLELGVNLGAHTFTVANSTGAQLASADVTAKTGLQYSLALLDPATSRANAAYRLVVISSATLPSSTQTGVRIFNAMSDGAEITAVFTPKDASAVTIATNLVAGAGSAVANGVAKLVSVVPGAGTLAVTNGDAKLCSATSTLVAGQRQRWAVIGTTSSATLVSWVGP